MKIALCLIVKDEEKVLRRCLESFQDLVDEISIVDTGSTDNTINIAKEFTSKICHYQEQYAIWSDSETIIDLFDDEESAIAANKNSDYTVRKAPLNYARARNLAQKDIKSNIVFSVDADEYLHPSYKKDFRKKVSEYLKQSNTILIPIYAGFDKSGDNPSHTHYLVRLFDKKCKWVGRIHEVIAYEKRVIAKDIILLHDKQIKQQPSDKISNYIANLKYESKVNPNATRPLFYLANTYFENSRQRESIEVYHKYLDLTQWLAEKAQALINLGKCYRDLKEYSKAKEVLIRAAATDPTRAEPWFYLGDVTNVVDWSEACSYYEIAAEYENKIPESILFLEPNCYTWLPWYRLSVGYDKIRNFSKGFEATKKALTYIPENKEMLHNLEYYSKNKNLGLQNQKKISNKPVNIIIPSATPNFAEKCIKSILDSKTNVPYMITLVADGEEPFPKFPEIVEIKKGIKPFVFARNINLGLTMTSDVIILNDDTQVSDYWLDDLQKVSRDQSIGIVSPLITDVGNIRQHVSSKESDVFWSTELNTLCFVCVYIPLEVLKQVGKLDENYIWYGYEDDDYCIRSKNSDFDLKICHTVIIKHRRHSTFKNKQSELVHKAYEYHKQKWLGKPIKTLNARVVDLNQRANLIIDSVLNYSGHKPNIIGQVIFNTFSNGKIIFEENCEVRHGSYFEVSDGIIRIGAGSVIGAGCFLQGNGDISIGKGTLIGPHCNIYSSYHPDTDTPFAQAPLGEAKVTIGNNVWIGAGVTILHGVIIGDNSIIGAHSLVNKDIPDGVVAFGTPAKVQRRRKIPIERQTGEHIEISHVERYKFVSQFLRHGDVVLDVGCGSGYGSQIILDTKKCKVVAIDISETAIERTKKIKRENLSILKADLNVFSQGFYDIIICFEVLEHIKDPTTALNCLFNLLKPNGKIFVSVPSDKVPASVNPYHYKHYSLSEFNDLISNSNKSRSQVYVYTQKRGEPPKDIPEKDADYLMSQIQKLSSFKRKVLFAAGVENTDRPSRWGFILDLFQSLASSFKHFNIDCLTLCHPILKNRSINTLAANEEVLIRVLDDWKPDFIFIWNGNSDGDQKVISAAKKRGVKIVYAELGWFPQKGHLHFDLQGVNAKSSIAFKEFEPLEKGQLVELIAYKKAFKLSKASDFEEKEEHILIALQDEKDSNILNSRFSSMYQFVEEALSFITKTYPRDQYPDLKIKVRPHPHCRNVKLPKSDIFEIDSDPIYKSIMEAREVHAINSTVLLEAALLDKKIVSYAPGLTYLHSIRYLEDGKFVSPLSFRLDALLYHLIMRQLNWSDLQNLEILKNYEVFRGLL